MKPYTRKELEDLPVGTWVWLTIDGCGGYFIKQTDVFTTFGNSFVYFRNGDRIVSLNFEGYGTKWTVYKNKEEAEGKSITLPYLLCTSRQFACVIWRDTDGKVKKTHTYPMQEAKAILREKEQLLVCKP